MAVFVRDDVSVYDAELRVNKLRTRPEKERVASSMSCVLGLDGRY